MKLLVALKDRAVDAYAPIMTVNTRGEAIRSLRDAMRDTNAPISRHPTDYELYALGNYNDATGEIVPFETPELLARAEDHKE